MSLTYPVQPKSPSSLRPYDNYGPESSSVPCPSSQCDRGYREGAAVFDSSGEPNATHEVCPVCQGMGIITRSELRDYIAERCG